MSQVKKNFVKFAEKMGKQDNQEMLMYYRAGWVTALELAIDMIKSSSFSEFVDHKTLEND